MRLIEKSTKSWHFALTSGKEGVGGQRALQLIVQPEMQAAQLSSEHEEGKDGSG